MSTVNAPTDAETVQPEPPEQDRPSRVVISRARIYAVIAPFLVLLVLWIYLFYGEGAFKGGPSGKAFGADYTMFVSAAQVLKTGGDPYNPTVLLRTETAWMHRLHRSMIKRSQRSQVRVGNPPLLYWAMEPLTGASFVPAALLSLFGLYLLSAVGFVATLRYFGWRKWILPTFIFLLMPQVVLGAFYGNVMGIVFAAMGLSLALSRRYPAAAGALMCLAWLKPPVALPVVLVLGAFHVQQRTRFATGFTLGTLGLFVLTLVTSGWNSLGLWVHGLLRYSNDMAIQPDVISLAGLYVRWMPPAPRLVLEALTVLGALALTVYLWKRRPAGQYDFLTVAPLWVVWMLAAPYGHFFDEIVLAIPVAAYLGQNGRRVACRLPGFALYLLFFSLFFISWAPLRVYLLPIPLVLIAVFMYRSLRDPRFHSA
jgi:Glycosyltransferase family 87